MSLLKALVTSAKSQRNGPISSNQPFCHTIQAVITMTHGMVRVRDYFHQLPLQGPSVRCQSKKCETTRHQLHSLRINMKTHINKYIVANSIKEKRIVRHKSNHQYIAVQIAPEISAKVQSSAGPPIYLILYSPHLFLITMNVCTLIPFIQNS